MRSSNGCWTCRLRRKKCDENQPVCDVCAVLHITCHFDQNKPEWMDGGVRQEEMAEQLKREVKEKGYRRHGDRSAHISREFISVVKTPIESRMLSRESHEDLSGPMSDLLNSTSDGQPDTIQSSPASTGCLQRQANSVYGSQDAWESTSFGQSDTVLFMFYLENLFPFLFPFYHPPLRQGGRAWLLQTMNNSSVFRQTALCQSSYFFSLVREMADSDQVWEKVLTKSSNAFRVLRQALQYIEGSDIAEHLHGAVRILSSIMQVQRFEIARLNFHNCQPHLSAAVALLRQLLNSPGVVESACPSSNFKAVMQRLGPESKILPNQCCQVPSAEQAAFRFSATLVIFDDIIASTMLQEQPRLYEYHHSLLGANDSTQRPINLEAVVGCNNWTMLQIGEIAVLDTWKQQCKRGGSLDVMELVHRATAIKESLVTHLTQLETNPATVPEGSSLLDVFTSYQQPKPPTGQTTLVSRIWTHAALVYLSIVVSGWQPASTDVRYHVGQIIELLTSQISPPTLLRTMVWPFCVAGCLAEPAQEAHLRGMVEALQPPSIFGTVHKALEIMENVWHNREATNIANLDLATCFRSQGDLVLLV